MLLPGMPMPACGVPQPQDSPEAADDGVTIVKKEYDKANPPTAEK
jgi:hypothetical protein